MIATDYKQGRTWLPCSFHLHCPGLVAESVFACVRSRSWCTCATTQICKLALRQRDFFAHAMGVIKALNVLGTLTAAVARSRSLRTTQLHWPSPPRKVREVRDAPKKCNALAIAQLGSALLQQTGL